MIINVIKSYPTTMKTLINRHRKNEVKSAALIEADEESGWLASAHLSHWFSAPNTKSIN